MSDAAVHVHDRSHFGELGERPLRLWPGLVIVLAQALLVIARTQITITSLPVMMAIFYGPTIGMILLLVWWLALSRASWFDRLLIPLAFVIAGISTFLLCDPSFHFGLMMYAIPAVSTLWVLWLLVSQFLPWSVRRLGLLMVFVIGWSFFLLLRMEGVDGSFSPELSWRWSATAEDLYMAERIAGRQSTGGEVSGWGQRRLL